MFKKSSDKNAKKILAANFFSLIVLRGFQFLIPLVTLPYLVRTVGLEKFGLISFASSLALYFGAIIQFGFGVTATREIARNRDNPDNLSKIYSTTLAASILLALASAILFVLIVFSFDIFSSYLQLYLSTLLFVIFQSLFPIWFFQGIEKMKYITFLTLGTSFIYIVSLVAFVKQEDDFKLVPLINAAAAAMIFFVAILIIKKKFKVHFSQPSMQEITRICLDGRHAFVSQLAPNLYNNSAMFLLGFFTNNTLVGSYAAATKLIDAVISFAYILSNTFLPYLSRGMQKHYIFRRIMLMSGLALTILTFVSAKEIMELLFGSGTIGVVVHIQWLAVCIFLVFITMTFGPNYLMLIGKEKIVKNIALYTSLTFFVVAVAVIPIWEVWGAIATLIGARFSIALLQFIFYLKYKTQVKFYD